jgi:hypothetical protein
MVIRELREVHESDNARGEEQTGTNNAKLRLKNIQH